MRHQHSDTADFWFAQSSLGARRHRLLWLVLAATLRAFWRVRATAGVLLMPYLAWVSFAAALNFATWRLNLCEFAHGRQKS